MSRRIPVPKSIHDDSKPFTLTGRMCASCAYLVPLTSEEIDFEKNGINRDEPHPCHERPNVYCVGSHRLLILIKEGKL